MLPGATWLIVREDTGIIDGFLAYRLEPERQERSMSTTELLIKSLEFARARTLGLLDSIEKEPDPQAMLAWRPGPGRAHIGWQLTHVAVTEEIFATERLAPAEGSPLEGTLAALSRRQHAGRRRALRSP